MFRSRLIAPAFLFCLISMFAGEVRGQCCPLMGDVNGDGRVNGEDVQGFVNLISPTALFDRRIGCADFDGDAAITSLDIAPFVTAMLLSSPTIFAFVMFEDPVTVDVDYQHISYSIVRTLEPTIRVVTNGIPPALIQILIDDGDDSTNDELNIRSLFTFDPTGTAVALVPEFVAVGSLPGGDQSLRALPDDPATMRIVYYGENRIRVMQGPTQRFSGWFLAYESPFNTVCGPHDGTEQDPDYPGDPDRTIMTNHLILDFQENEGITDSQISYGLCRLQLRPQGITRDLGVVQTRPLTSLDGSQLQSLAAQINSPSFDPMLTEDTFEEARLDRVATDPAILGENVPQGMVNDAQPASNDWLAGARQQQYHHFILQTFIAHRLIDANPTDPVVPTQVYMTGSGVGAGENFSGGASGNGNRFFVKGNRLKTPSRIVEDRRGRVETVEKYDDGDLRSIPDRKSDATSTNDHDSLVLNIIGGDGIGDRQAPFVFGVLRLGNITGRAGMTFTSNITTTAANQFANGQVELLNGLDQLLGVFKVTANTAGVNADFTLSKNVPGNAVKFRNLLANELRGQSIVLGTGKDANIRVVFWGGGELAYYEQLEISADDTTSKIHIIERSMNTAVARSDPESKNITMKYKAVAESGKVIIGAAWNEFGAEVFECDTGRISPDRTIRRTDKKNGNVTDFVRRRFISNISVLRNEYVGGTVELLKADDTSLGTFTIEYNSLGPNSQFTLTQNVPANTAKFRNLFSEFKKRVLSVGGATRVHNVPNSLEVKAGYSNTGTRICVVAPGEEIVGTARDGTLVNFDGTSFATPQAVGIAAGMMHVNSSLRADDGLTTLPELMEITADDLDAAGRDNNTGFGRLNFWKCILAAVNNGASKEGRADTTPADGKDDFFTSVTLKDAANTAWYGFEIRVKVKDAVVWFRTNGGAFQKVEDSGARRAPIGGGSVPLLGNVTGFTGMELTTNVTTEGADQFAGGTIELLKADDTSLGTHNITANTAGANAKITLSVNVPANTAKFRNLFIKASVVACGMSTQTLRKGDGKILPSLPFSAAELAGATMTQFWLARFNITKADLEGKSHLLVMKPGKVPTDTTEGGDTIMSFPINIAQMRDPANAPDEIKNRVKEFDDFVFHCQKD